MLPQRTPARAHLPALLVGTLLAACGDGPAALAHHQPPPTPLTTPSATPPEAIQTAVPTLGAAAPTPTPTNRVAPTPTPRPPAPRPTAPPAPLPSIGGCPVFPADNPWNQDISTLNVDPHSATYVASIDTGAGFVHPDFGSNPTYGIPYTVVSQAQPAVPITFTAYGDESDPGPYPIPTSAPVESGSDRHVLAVQQGTCDLYEMFAAQWNGAGWSCASGAVFDLRSDRLRPDTWTSADEAGLPILPGLVRFDEVQSGAIHHALRFTVNRTQRAFIHPATHYGQYADASAPPMGERFRLEASFDTSHFHGEAKVILEALKRYGMYVADTGGSWFITGATDSRWNDADLDQLKTVPGTAFEAVTTGAVHRGY